MFSCVDRATSPQEATDMQNDRLGRKENGGTRNEQQEHAASDGPDTTARSGL